ncbi:hypothetical protein ACU686_26120 [Yinghuangia aomiensis]
MDTFETDAAALAALRGIRRPGCIRPGPPRQPPPRGCGIRPRPRDPLRLPARAGLRAPVRSPQPMAERLFWWRNAASTPVDDYLGLRVGDAVMVQLPGEAIAGTVVETKRSGARVVCPWLAGTPNETNLEVTVHSRNVDGAWYGSY